MYGIDVIDYHDSSNPILATRLADPSPVLMNRMIAVDTAIGRAGGTDHSSEASTGPRAVQSARLLVAFSGPLPGF